MIRLGEIDPIPTRSATIQENELPSGQPTSRRSGEIESMKSATLEDMLESIGRVDEGPKHYNGSEESKECELGDTSLVVTSQLLQESTGMGCFRKSPVRY